MAADADVRDVEKLREQLESNVAKLQASLRHWQQWEIEYEGMKEELSALGHRHTRRDLADLEHEQQDDLFGGSQGALLNAKERKVLLYDAKGKMRSATAIIGLISRRIDYVQQNVKSVLSLLEAAVQRLSESGGPVEPSKDAEEPLPLTEISEELDADGNVVSSAVSHPEQIQPETLKAFEENEAQIAGKPQPRPLQNSKSPTSQDSVDSISQVSELSSHETETQDTEMCTSDSHHSDHAPRKHRRPKTRKRVSFAEGTKAEHDPSEHPLQLPKETQIDYFRQACSQLRRQLARNVTARNMGGFNDLNALSQASDAECAYQILRMAQNREAKRLLKAQGLDLKGAARVLCKMAELSIYDDEDAQVVNVIEEARELRSTASSSRESSPGAIRDVLSVSNAGQSGDLVQHTGPEWKKGSLSSEESVDKDKTATWGASTAQNGNDTPEEAALRRQMLAYNMNEVGSIVAELEIDDNDSNDNESEDLMSIDADDDYGDDEDEDEDEDEDKFGRAASKVLSGKYIEEMRALEATLKAKAMINAGPVVSTNEPLDMDLAHASKKQKNNDGAKGVRFADQIEIQEVPSSPHLTEAPVIERADLPATGPTPPSKTRKPSRFKASRVADRPGAMLGQASIESRNAAPSQEPRTTPLGHRPVVEREVVANKADAPEPEDPDDAFMQQQVRNEYHRLRNNLIAREGGFGNLETEDSGYVGDENVSILEADAPVGSGKKMSRFRAARLGLASRQ